MRIKCLVCMGKLFHVVDKFTTTEKLIPCLQQIPSREPGVLMSMCGVFQAMIQSPYVHLYSCSSLHAFSRSLFAPRMYASPPSLATLARFSA